MPPSLLNVQFLLIAVTNFSLFMVMATWNFLPVFIVDIGGDAFDAGIVMGAMGVTSLASIPFLTPLMDRYGRRRFIIGGALLVAVSNGGFLPFHSYSHLMILVRLVQGVGFASCFNACSTAVVDLVPREHRAQGIGIFAVSSSAAIAIGPYIGEKVLLSQGHRAYFLLLIGFGLIGCMTGLLVKEPASRTIQPQSQGFFPTASRNNLIPMMLTAAVFGAGFAAMSNFFPLHAKRLGLQAGPFFTSYGVSLLLVRLLLGHLADTISRKTLVFACLIGFGLMLGLTACISTPWHTLAIGLLFGLLQGLAYPAMMANMVDRSDTYNRAVVVGLYTGSFGAGINLSLFAWGYIADLEGLPFMFLSAAALMLIGAAVSLVQKVQSRGTRG
jgi:MFS family permease